MNRQRQPHKREASTQRPPTRPAADVSVSNATLGESVTGEVEEAEFSFLDAASAQLGSEAPPPGEDGAAPPEDLPHRAQLEAALGVDLSDVPVVRSGGLGAIGARAAATADGIVLGDDTSIEVVAEEVVHWLQLQGTGGGLGGTSDPGDPAEVEARAIAEQIATGQSPDAILQRATSGIMRNADGLTATERTRLRELAATAAADLYREIDSVWTVDSTLIARVTEYRTAVRAMRSEPWFMDQALRILGQAYRQLARTGLINAVRSTTSGEDRTLLFSRLRVRNIPPPESTESSEESTPEAEASADQAEGSGDEATAAEAPSNRLSAQELDLARRLTDRCIMAIRGELRAIAFTEDANVLAGLRQWHAAILELIDRPETPPTGAARNGKIRQAKQLLRHRYGHQTNHSLRTDIENGMQWASETEALRLVGGAGASTASSTSQTTPQDSGASATEASTPPDQGYVATLQALNALFRATWTNEASVERRCNELAAWAREAAGDRDASNLGTWTAERDRQLQEATDDYGRRYGIGLSSEIRSHVWDDAVERRCLDAIGDRGGVSDTVAAATMDTARPDEDADVLLAATDDLTAALTPIAEALQDELTDLVVSGDAVKRHCATFDTTWRGMANDERFGDRMENAVFARSILLQLYADMEGSLVDDISNRLWSHADKDASFRSLGLGYTNLAVSLEEQGQAGSADAANMDTEDRLQVILEASLNSLFNTVRTAVEGRDRRSGDRSSDFRGYVRDVEAGWTSAVGVARSHDRDGAAVRSAYEQVHGISLGAHLSLACEDEREAERMSEAAGGVQVRVASLGAASDQGELSEDVEISGDVRERTNAEGEYEAFDRDDAYALAQELYAAIDGGNRAEVSRILTHDRPAAERQAIVDMFNQTYPVTLRFFMRQHFGADGADIQLLEAASSESGRFDPTEELRHMVAASDESIYIRVMDLSPEEKRAVLADSALMTSIRAAFGDDGYERVRNTLTGHLGVDDMMRTRDTETFWGMGTDEQGFEQDLGAYVAMRRRELLPAALRAGREAEKTGDALRTWVEARIRSQLEPELIRMSGTPEAIEVVFSEIGGEDYLQAMMRMDTTTGELDHAQSAQADPTGPQILTHLRALSSSQRQRLLADDDFVLQLQDNPTATHLQAMAILRGESGMADIEAGLDNLDTDETQVFRGLTEGDADRMQAIARDDALRGRIAGELDGESSDDLDQDVHSERALFEEMMGDFEDLDAAPEATDVAARRARRTTELVIRHKFRILAGFQDDNDALLLAAQEVYNERGSFKATTDAEEEFLFDIRDGTHGQAARAARARIQAEVMPRIVTPVSDDTCAPVRGLPLIVQGAILGTQDPARERLGRALAYQTDETAVASTLSTVSNRTLALHWSNIRERGRRGGRFVDVVGPWITAGRPETGPEWSRLVDFRLGLAEGVDQRLRDDWMVGESDLDSWRSTLQGRILGLPWSEVKAALIDGGCTGVEDTDEERLIGQDRQARSRLQHREDRFAQSRADGSAIDGLADSDDAVDRAYMQLHGEFEADVADDGQLSDDELQRIRGLEGYVDNAEAEYREAKSNASTYATTMAATIIGAAATLVSGPGGPSLTAALITAATQAAVTTALDEAIQGRDFDAIETGLRRMATECATAGLTHGLGAAFTQATQSIPGAGDLLARAAAWRQGLGQASRTSRNALLRHALVSGAISGAEGLRDNAVEAVVNAIDDLFANGWDRATQNINMGGAIEQWSLEYLRTFVTSAATTYSDEEIRRIFQPHIEAGGGRAVAANLGRDVAQQGGRTVAGGMGNAAEDVATGRPLRALDRDNYDASDVGTFAIGAGRRTVNRLAGDERDSRNAELADELMRRPDIRDGVRGLDRPEGMTQAQIERMYRARILSEGAPGEGQAATDLEAFRTGPLRRIQEGIARQTEGRDLSAEDRTAFVEWVVGTRGSGGEGRVSSEMGYDAFERSRAAQAQRPVSDTSARRPAREPGSAGTAG